MKQKRTIGIKYLIPPKHSGNFSAALQMPWINISYLLTVVGDRYASPQNIERNLIDRYAEQTVSLNRTFTFGSCSLRLQFDIINIGNINYDVVKVLSHAWTFFPRRTLFLYIKTRY